MPSRVKAILFDWDNTLVDSWRMSMRAFNRTLIAFGKDPVSEVEVLSRPQTSVRDSFPDIFGHDSDEAIVHYYEKGYQPHEMVDLGALPGSDQLIRQIKESGLFTAVVSNKNGDRLREEVKHFGWDDVFSAVVGSNDALQDKPSADPILYALREFTEPPTIENVWMVGDSIIDIKSAQAAGVRPVLIGSARTEYEDHSGVDDILQFKDCANLHRYLFKK